MFGYSLATGDFNRDGYDDLAVGVPFEDIDYKTDTGAVNVLYIVPGAGIGNESDAGEVSDLYEL